MMTRGRPSIIAAFGVLLWMLVTTVTPNSAQALSLNPEVWASCVGIDKIISAPALAPIQVGGGVTSPQMGWQLGGSFMPVIYNAIEPAIKSILCEGTSLEEDISRAGKQKRHETVSTLKASDIISDKEFGMRAVTAAQSKEGANNLPAGACDQVYRASYAGSAVSATATTALAFNSQSFSRDITPSQTSSRLNATAPSSPGAIVPEAVLGAGDLSRGGVITNAATAQMFIQNLTNPVQQAPISPTVQGSPAYASTLARKNFQTTSISLAQKSLTDIAAVHAPMAGLSAWSAGIDAETGLVPVGVGNPPGDESLVSIIAQEIQSRFSGTTYVTGLFSSLQKRHIAQESAGDQAVRLELAYQNLILAQDEESLDAEILANLTTKTK